MYQDLQRTCTVIVYLIKPFVWCRSRCRRRRGLLELPTYGSLDVTNFQDFGIWTVIKIHLLAE